VAGGHCFEAITQDFGFDVAELWDIFVGTSFTVSPCINWPVVLGQWFQLCPSMLLKKSYMGTRVLFKEKVLVAMLHPSIRRSSCSTFRKWLLSINKVGIEILDSGSI